MRVTARDEVDAVNLRRNERLPALTVFVVAHVRHANDETATLFFTQFLHDLTSRHHGIDISHTFEIVRRNQRNGTNTQTKQTDSHSADGFHDVTFDALLEHCSSHVIVRGNDVEVRELQRCRERFHSVVKLMIAECPRVITDR